MQDLFTEDYKMFLNDLKEDLNKWKGIPTAPWSVKLT